VSACHDVSDGGLLVAVAEMALAGDIGAVIVVPEDVAAINGWLFGEDQGRYVLAAAEGAGILAAARAAGVPAAEIGRTGGVALTVSGTDIISLEDLRDLHEGWLPGYMAAP